MYIAATDRLYPQKSAIVLNPHSGRTRKLIGSIRELAATVPGTLLLETTTLIELEQMVDGLKPLGVNHLIIIGGDGTVQAVINRLFNSGLWPVMPLLSIVPGGTTNMTATDIGSIGNPRHNLDRLARCLRAATGARLVTRQVLQIRQAEQPSVYGMFFGTGIISRGAGYFHRKIKKSGVTGESASAIVILRLLAGLLTGRKSGEWAPARINLADDSGLRLDNNCIMLFASTLDRLLLGLRPYWGPGQGAVHTTCIKTSPQKLWRSLLKIIFRQVGSLAVSDGYYSRHNAWLELTMDEPYIVDGEFYDCDSRNGPLRISSAGPLRFLLP